MTTINMSFRPTPSLKDEIEFVANYKGKSMNQVIISSIEKSIKEEKEDIQRELFFTDRAVKAYEDYKNTWIAYSLSDF